MTRRWREDGFVILPGYLSCAQVQPAVDELPLLFPTAEEYHGGSDQSLRARFDEEFGGIDDFPFAATAVNLVAVHPDLVALAATLLGTERLRVYSIEAWAKYTGAADYDQHHHRDYLSQTMLVPSSDPLYQQVEMFLYLSDVPTDLGPPSFVPRRHATDLPSIPNWFPRTDDVGVDVDHPSWVAQRPSRALRSGGVGDGSGRNGRRLCQRHVP